jgi:nucleoside phosphorylase
MQEEYEYFVSVLPTGIVPSADQRVKGTGYRFSMPGRDGASKDCVATYPLREGHDTVGHLARFLLEEFDPAATVLLGIAGGIGDDIGVGDVAIAIDAVQFDNAGKRAPNGSTYQEQFEKCSEALCDRAAKFSTTHVAEWNAIRSLADAARRSIAEQYRHEPFVSRYLNGLPLRAVTGRIASSRFVHADATQLAEVLKWHRKAIAVETEGYGFLDAVEVYDRLRPKLIIRGISDPANEDKEELERITQGACRRLAMQNCGRFFLALLEAGAFGALPQLEILPAPTSARDDDAQLQKRREFILRKLLAFLRVNALGRKPDDERPYSEADNVMLSEVVSALLGSDLLDAYTKDSFADEIWQELVTNPQIIGRPQNHLHYSNAQIAFLIRDDLNRRKLNGYFDNGPKTVRVLEAGSGGCNTTNSVISAILAGDWKGRDNLKIEYLGLEINQGFVDIGNAFFRGDGPQQDPRSALHHRLVTPWAGRENFIDVGNAPALVRGLLQAPQSAAETVDYFFSSYMMHHVPNGDALLRYLFGRHSDQHNRLPNPRSAPELFVQRLDYYLGALEAGQISQGDVEHTRMQLELLEQAASSNFHSVTDILAFNLATHVKDAVLRDSNSRPKFLESVRAMMGDAHAGRSDQHRAHRAEWRGDLFVDPQLRMLLGIRELLKPNGVLVIADPDGTSTFNRTKAAMNDKVALELYAAQFRSAGRLSELLHSAGMGFVVAPPSTVVQWRDGVFDVRGSVDDFVRKRPELSDHNLGYVVFARKPVSSLFLMPTSRSPAVEARSL